MSFFFFSKKGQKKVFCGLLYRKLAILEYKNIHLEKSKILHFSKGVSPCFLVKNGKIGQNSVFSGLVDRKLAILDYENIDFQKSKILHFLKGVSPWFSVKNWKLSPLLLFSETGKKKVFCGLLETKLAILDHKKIYLKKSKILHFSQEVSPLVLCQRRKICTLLLYFKLSVFVTL